MKTAWSNGLPLSIYFLTISKKSCSRRKRPIPVEPLNIEGLLKKAIGLETASVGQGSLKRALERRMSALCVSSQEAYLSILNSSKQELAALIEEVIVPETWFFRDKDPFDALIQFSSQWFKKNSDRILRLLSIPCSTGEEPYSMAISLVDAGLPQDRFSIDAADISSRALEHARQGFYKEYAFRENNPALRQKYFRKIDDGFLLDETIRKKVRFVQENILTPCFLNGNKIYDVIFCRNLLIYLNKHATRQALNTLDRLLKDDGILFVGHAETGRIPAEKFVPAPYPRSFAFLKKTEQRPMCCIKPPCAPPAARPAPPRGKSRKKCNPKCNSIGNSNKKKIPQADLEEARRLADRGDLEEARAICELYLHQHGPSAHAYFLLGVVWNASGDTHRAHEALHKAIYLKPDHYEALLLLALIAERSGDQAKAEALMRRARRAKTTEAEVQ